MGKAIKFTLIGAAVGAAAAAAKARGGESSGDMPVKAAKGAGVGAVAGGLLGIVSSRRGKKKLDNRMKLASMVSAGALVEAARQAKPAIEKQSRRARKAAIRAAKDARRSGRRTAKRVGRRATHAAELARLQADHLVDVGRHKLAVSTTLDLDDALAYLSGHVNLEREVAPRAAARRLDRVRRLVELMGDPQRTYPVIHITGTNGKGSVARMVTALLVARGLRTGTYTSPHLERLNERMAHNGEPIPDEDLAEVIGAVADLEPLLGSPPTHFEILTAAAFRWFADIAVDVGVVEVGLGGRWDATNVADGQVAVLTNVSLDHAETIGPALTDIATEKTGIVKPGSTFVLAETNPSLLPILEGTEATETWIRGTQFRCGANRLAHEGRVVDLSTPGGTYPGVFLPVHGPYQGDNAAVALAAVEAFFGAPLAPEVVAEAFAGLRLPGRLEVVTRHPVCVLDGAHNPAGALAATAALDEAFGSAVTGRILVIGLLQGRDPVEMLRCFDAGRARLVVACPPPSPRALPAADVAAAARALGTDSEEADSVSEAVATALALAGDKELVHVTGSLYVVGAARAALRTA